MLEYIASKRGQLFFAFLFQYADDCFDPRLLQLIAPLSVNNGIRIDHANTNAFDSGFNDRFCAGGCATCVAAGLQRHIHVGAPGAFTCFMQSDDFGMPDRDSYTMNTMSKNNRPWREMVCRVQCIWTTTSYNRTHMHVREYG